VYVEPIHKHRRIRRVAIDQFFCRRLASAQLS
jgi:hypothetical protein